MGYNQKRGITLVELVMVIAIIGVISLTSGSLLVFLIQNSVFIPSQLNMDMIASDALDIMIEGDSQAKGLRFSRSITDIQDYQLTFNNQDNQSVRYRLDTGIHSLYRSINAGGETAVPYYADSEADVFGKSNKVFTYYDAGGLITSNPADVRRIEITLIAQTGTGSYEDWEGNSEQSTSIAVKKFQ